MMKNIRRIADIKAEKMKLRIKELELEKEIRQNWKELKVELRPDTFLRNKILHYTHQKEEEENFCFNTFTFGYWLFFVYYCCCCCFSVRRFFLNIHH